MNNLLNSILENTMEGTLKYDTVEIIMDQVDGLDNEEILEYVAQIINYGCVSGIVTSLITYKDTDEFFDNHSNEILELLDNDKEEGILDINEIEFNKNWLSWYAFERITFDIQYELEAAAELM